ncbi:MAG TPA: hypothetical protein VGK32_14810 [Vicinamibacterales bacterium]|jgi:hypothetical protein
MRLALLAVLLSAAIVSGGCLVSSLQPFYDDASIEFDDALLGSWENPDDKSIVRVDRGEWKSYKVTYPARSGPVVMTGVLSRLGESRVFDLSPGRPTDPAALFIPAHLAVRLQVLGDTVTVTGFDYDWFLHETEGGRLTKLRAALDGRTNVVLTADTAGLRSWMAAQPRGGDMFADAIRFVRKSR